MRFSLCCFLLVGSPLCWASVLEVGPIFINGSGSLYDPDHGVGEGFPGTEGTAFSAFGSNGTDSVSITVFEIDLVPQLPMPSVGSSLALSAATITCLVGSSSVMNTVQCVVNIDGITALEHSPTLAVAWELCRTMLWIV
jgi:hypothetical protein